jgi:hypothetical protein
LAIAAPGNNIVGQKPDMMEIVSSPAGLDIRRLADPPAPADVRRIRRGPRM